jgi:hypothetical protein
LAELESVQQFGLHTLNVIQESPAKPFNRTVAVGLLIVAATLSWVLTPLLPPLDDAYIALHSAQSVLRGSDPSYGTPPLTGVTSPAYVALLTLVVWTTGSPLLALRIVNAGGLLAFATALWWLAAGPSHWTRVMVVATIIASGVTLLNATNGLETGWALALVTGMIAAIRGERRGFVAFCAGILPWVRPDLVPMAAALLAYAGWPVSWADRWRLIGRAAAVTLPFALWLWAGTGHWLPQTMSAKRYWFAEDSAVLGTRLLATGRALLAGLVELAPMSVALVFLFRSRLGRVGAVLIGVTLIVYAFALPGALWHNYHRYLYAIVLPWMALGLVEGVRTWRWNRAVLVGALLLLMITWAMRQPDSKRVATEFVAAADAVDMLIPQGAVVLVHDAGALSVYTSHKLVDMVGLKTPSSIAVHRDLTWSSGGKLRAAAVSKIAEANNATTLVTLNEWDGIFGIASGLRAEGWQLTPLRENASGYAIYTMTRTVPGK